MNKQESVPVLVFFVGHALVDNDIPKLAEQPTNTKARLMQDAKEAGCHPTDERGTLRGEDA